MKWWMRDDWQERLMIAGGCFLTLLGTAEAILGFGPGGFERWVGLPLGLVILVLSIVLFRRRRTRTEVIDNELDHP